MVQESSDIATWRKTMSKELVTGVGDTTVKSFHKSWWQRPTSNTTVHKGKKMYLTQAYYDKLDNMLLLAQGILSQSN